MEPVVITSKNIINSDPDYIVENLKLCRCLLLNPKSDSLTGKLTAVMKQKGIQVRQEMGVQLESHKADYIHQFIACGAMGMVKQWLLEGMPLSKKEMVELAEKNAGTVLARDREKLKKEEVISYEK